MAPGSGMPACLPRMLTVHSQITLSAPCCRKTVTMCRQAATKVAGAVCRYPHEYQKPFISWPKLMATGKPNSCTCWAYLAR